MKPERLRGLIAKAMTSEGLTPEEMKELSQGHKEYMRQKATEFRYTWNYDKVIN